MTTYYVDSASSGGDGTTTAIVGATAAFATIAAMQAKAGGYAAGDSILLKRGCTWREQLTVPSSGSEGSPITFGAYATGAKPILDGKDVIASFTSYASATRIFDEQFSNGYDETHANGETLGTGSALDEAANPADVGSPSGWGTKCLKATETQASQNAYVSGIASWGTTVYFRDEFVVTAEGIDDGQYNAFFTAWNVAWSATPFSLYITQEAGVLKAAIQINTDGTPNTYHSTAISLNARHRVEVKYDIAGDAWEWRLDGVTQNSGALTSTHPTDFGTYRFGADVFGNGPTLTIYHDLWAIDSALWVGAEDVNIYKKESLAWEPLVLVDDGARLTKVASLDALDSNGEWFYSGGTLYLKTSDGTDPAGSVIEGFRRQFGVDLGAHSYITVDGLEFTGHQKTAEYAYGAGVNWTIPTTEGTYQGITIQNCTFTHEGDYAISGWIGAHANTRTVTGIVIQDNVFDEAHWTLLTETARVFIVLYSGDNADGFRNVTIQRNTIFDDISIHPTNDHAVQTDGISITLSGGENLVSQNTVQGTSHGIVLHGLVAGVDLGIIEKNYVHDTSDDCVWIDGNCGAIRISYNIFGPTKDCGIDTVRVLAGTQEDMEIYNNVIYYSDNPGIDLIKVTRATIKNNIFKETGQLDDLYGIRQAFRMNDNGEENTTYPTLVSDYNCFYHADGARIGINDLANGNIVRTIAQWVTLSSQDTHSVSPDPLFVSPSTGDFHLQAASPCRDAGVVIAGLTSDYAGVPVPLGLGVDIGAYEFIPGGHMTAPSSLTALTSIV